MNIEFLNLGKEIVTEISKTWASLEYLNPKDIKSDTLESIGRQFFRNKEVFNDYLEYKYCLKDYYINHLNKELENPWIAEWWFDERGAEFQKNTFPTLVNLVIDSILNSGWYFDEANEYYLPKNSYIDENTNELHYNLD